MNLQIDTHMYIYIITQRKKPKPKDPQPQLEWASYLSQLNNTN